MVDIILSTMMLYVCSVGFYLAIIIDGREVGNILLFSRPSKTSIWIIKLNWRFSNLNDYCLSL